MNKYEEIARNLKAEGNNCSYSVYNALKKALELNGEYPAPRSIEGKCGALLSALKILDETGNADKKEEFEKEFIKEFGYSKCIELMTHEKRCSDYVGWSAKKINEILLKEFIDDKKI